MPTWAQYAIAAAAVIVAVGTIWTKVVRPAAMLISHTEELLPLLRDLRQQLKDTPGAFEILKDIIGQFRTNSGSSLRDVVDRLETASKENRQAAELLKSNVETVRHLAEQDRMQAARTQALLIQVEAKIGTAAATALRMELAAAGVADDLAASHSRADHINPASPPGTAADAASRPAQ